MEVWNDVEKNKYFIFDTNTGFKSQCDKYGKNPTTFTPYKSGFYKSLTCKAKSPDKNYRIQPKKFDGYFQCPRPALEPQHKSKVRLIDDVSTLPRPVNSLQFSSIYDKNVSPPSFKTPSPRQNDWVSSKTYTLDELRKNLLPPAEKNIKTAHEMKKRIESDKFNFPSFREKSQKLEKRMLKGYFMTNVPSSTDLFQKEKKLLKVTNPLYFDKLAKYDELDRKYLKKRREQKILKNKLSLHSN